MPRTASGNLRLFIASFLVCALLFGCILSLSNLNLCIRINNTNNILYLFKKLFEEGLKKMGKNIDDDELSEYLNILFAYSNEPIKSLKRRMAYTKTPMDVLPWKYRY